ncbi:hypothetical protein ACF1BE_13590 [Streptomyces sp. NPDC014991]|uniref:hypothetical protein n=1 Tax=Streptomyces sp. NPDC014991 TaxID=3364935 RepID=UPI0036FC0AE4
MEVNRWTDVWVGAAATTSERSYDAPRAVGEERRALRRGAREHRRAVPADRNDPADVVLRAARTARRRSGVPDGGVDLVVHAASGGPGAGDGTAARVLRGLGCPAATAWEVWRPADGGVLALHLAAQYVSGRPETPLTALVTTMDSASEYADRRREPPGRMCTDEAAGLVLTTTAGMARLLSTAALGEPPHGALLRTDLPWRVPAPGTPPRTRGRLSQRVPWSWSWGRRRGRRPAEETAGHGVPSGHGVQLSEREREAVVPALAECGRAVDDVACFVLTRTGGGGQAPGGHIAELARLLEDGRSRRGDTVVLVGGDERGVGCAVLEIP